MATGMWYHGDEAQPTLNSTVFQRKLGDSGPDSDLVSVHYIVKGETMEDSATISGQFGQSKLIFLDLMLRPILKKAFDGRPVYSFGVILYMYAHTQMILKTYSPIIYSFQRQKIKLCHPHCVVQVLSGEVGGVSDSSRGVEYTMVTDSEMSYSTTAGDMKSSAKRLPRRRLLSSEEFSDMLDDEEELDIDDAQFMLERQKSRRERIKLQKKSGKRRGRKVSVGLQVEVEQGEDLIQSNQVCVDLLCAINKSKKHF